MKNTLLICVLLFCVSCLFVPKAYTQEQDTDAIANQLSSELEKAGICTPEGLKQIKRPLKDMLGRGATKRGLKRTVGDLTSRGITGRDLKKAVDSMNDLVKDGESPKEAGNVVSRAARQGRREGLKGKELVARVHEAVRQRKQERQQLKQEMKRLKREHKGKIREIEDDLSSGGRRRYKGRGQKGKAKKNK
ncbi:MAG: hypothetical protein JSW18_04425 [Candidatus Omnitrophota bacterium]|nr:MAG: hypothetical protein JSW18_04425 [Candidatus Omnitrophota bacterium]